MSDLEASRGVIVDGTISPLEFWMAFFAVAIVMAGLVFALILATILTIRDQQARGQRKAPMAKDAETRHGEAFEAHDLWDRDLDT